MKEGSVSDLGARGACRGAWRGGGACRGGYWAPPSIVGHVVCSFPQIRRERVDYR